MKKLILILITLCYLQTTTVQSQTKKATKQVSSKRPVTKKATVAKVAPKPPVVVTQEKVSASKPSPQPKAFASEQPIQKKIEAKKVISETSYKAALGLKFIYGLSLTGKLFLKQNSALEGILRYNGAGGQGSNIAFSGLYEYHSDIKSVSGLRWYLGAGGYVNYFSWKGVDADAVTTFGVVGIIGLEYKFRDLPIAISADWQPGYIISNGVGFSAENGGIGVKYTF